MKSLDVQIKEAVLAGNLELAQSLLATSDKPKASPKKTVPKKATPKKTTPKKVKAPKVEREENDDDEVAQPRRRKSEDFSNCVSSSHKNGDVGERNYGRDKPRDRHKPIDFVSEKSKLVDDKTRNALKRDCKRDVEVKKMLLSNKIDKTDRRDPAPKVTAKCPRCNKKHKVYASQLPERVEGSDPNSVVCLECAGEK